MDAIIQYFDSLGIDFWQFVTTALVLLVGSLVISLLGRFVFGRKSTLCGGVSSAIAVLFIYALTVVLHSCGARYEQFITPLPLVEISGDYMNIFVFSGQHYTQICGQILSTIILAFLINLAGGWLPQGKNIFSWVFFRSITVLLGFVFHWIVVWLFATYLPEGIVTYAPTILLGILVTLLLTGALRILVGALITISNPVVGGLYTFFFATLVGRQLTKSVLAAAILCALALVLNYFGYIAIYIASAALIAYIPFVILLIAVWYLIGKVL